MKEYIFELPFKVRDYECDMQGIVNNAIYQHYLEHTRHEFITQLGIHFGKLNPQEIAPVVARIEIAYKRSLRSGDQFVSKLNVKKEGIKYLFFQDIYNEEGICCIMAKVTVVCIISGQIGHSELFDQALKPYLSHE